MISSMINHEQAVRDKLQMLKLHLGWPDRDKHMGRPDEGLFFYDWLQRERAQAAVVQKIRRVEDVVAFIVANRVVLGRSVEVRNARRESRHETNLQVLVNVSEASDADFVGLSSRCTTIDLGLHGMRVRSEKRLPEDGKFRLTVAPVGFPITIYDLVGDPRWVTNDEGGYQMGIQIAELDDWERWQAEFDTRFLRR